MKILACTLLAISLSTALALTPEERVIVLHAKAQIADWRVEREAAKAETQLLKQAAADSSQAAEASARTAAMTGEKLTVAEGQIKDERVKLQLAVNEVARQKKIVDRVTGPWWLPGLHAIRYGIGLMLKRLLILAGSAILLFVGLAVASALGVPGLGFALSLAKRFGGVATGLTSKLSAKALKFAKKKATTVQP